MDGKRKAGKASVRESAREGGEIGREGGMTVVRDRGDGGIGAKGEGER